MDFDLFDKNLIIILDNFKDKLGKISISKITPDLFTKVKVNYYGKLVLLSNVASITNVDSRSISVILYDNLQLKVVYNSLLALKLNVSIRISSNNEIRIMLLELTKELRFSLLKQVKEEEEVCKINLRQLRKKWNQLIKELCKVKRISKDEESFLLNEIQKKIDLFTVKIIELGRNKNTLLSNV